MAALCRRARSRCACRLGIERGSLLRARHLARTASDCQSLDVRDALRAVRHRHGVNYVAPLSTELDAFRDWFREVFESARTGEQTARVAPPGFELMPLPDGVWLVA